MIRALGDSVEFAEGSIFLISRAFSRKTGSHFFASALSWRRGSVLARDFAISPGMRPSLLDPLFAPASALPGIGPKNAKLFDRLLDRPQGARVVDVLFHLPQATVDRRSRPKIRDAVPDTIVTIEARVTEHRGPPNARSRAPFKVLVEDDTGDVELVFFLANHDWVRSRLPIGATRWISGKLELWDGRRQIVHPDRVMNAEEFARLPAVEPVYGLTEGLYQRTVARASEAALKRLPRLMEWIGEETLSRLKLPSFADALGAMHRPKTPEDVDPAGPAATRLAYDELLANQLALLLMRARMRSTPGRAHLAEGTLGRRLEAALPFSLTQAQRKAIDDIRADLRAEKRMLRLLQGDVGSGKTVVALLAMADVVEAGRQAAMMAPTEILARQHYERMAPLAESAGLRIALLTGRDKASERRASLAALAEGTIDVAVGTHALFQESVAFADLGLAVVDEQHRFGVRQRLALASKGAAVDLLVMTATPIPRSLVLAYFGDMDVSALREKPPGRQPIDTASCRSNGSRRSSPESPGRCARARGPTGSARWSKRARRSTSRRLRIARRPCARFSARPSDSCTARWRAPSGTPRWSASSAARRRSWSRPRSSRSASTCPRRRS